MTLRTAVESAVANGYKQAPFTFYDKAVAKKAVAAIAASPEVRAELERVLDEAFGFPPAINDSIADAILAALGAES